MINDVAGLKKQTLAVSIRACKTLFVPYRDAEPLNTNTCNVSPDFVPVLVPLITDLS